ncbi:pilin [Patescibacteria group bacterium]|nr:pilin [Patescibacteria group bacterium]
MIPIAITFITRIASTGTVCSGGQIYSEADQTCYNTNLPTVAANGADLQQALQIFFGILAALAVLFVVIGGLRYTISGGDAQAMSKAKSTIIYAIVGLVVAIFAEAIVTFVLGFVK